MSRIKKDGIVLLTGNSVPKLAGRISEKLGIPVSDALVGRFEDDEVRVQIGTNVALRNKNVFVIQSTNPPAEHWFELWLLADAARRAGARDIIWVAPYMGYARQDRKIKGHDPISAKVALDLTVAAGVTQIIAVDMHCGQLQGFVNLPFANLWGRKLVLQHILKVLKILGISLRDKKRLAELAIIAPDPGSYPVASHYAGKLNCILIPGHKTRPQPNKSKVILIGSNKVEGRDCIILDEMVDTGGSTIDVSEQLKEKGARRILAGMTHPLLSGNAVECLEKSPIEKVVVADTIPLKRTSHKIEVVSIANELAKAIKYAATEGIISNMYEQF